MKKSEEIRISLDNTISTVRFCSLIYNELNLFFIHPDIEKLIKRFPIFNSIILSYKAKLSQDICILFNRFESYSIPKLFNKILNDYKLINWYIPIDKEIIKEFFQEYSFLIETESFKKIKDVRDKYYSHLDKSAPTIIKINLNEFDELIQFAMKVVSEIANHLDNTFTSFQMDGLGGKLLINSLENYNKLEEIITKSYLERKEKIDTKDLLNIVKLHWTKS